MTTDLAAEHRRKLAALSAARQYEHAADLHRGAAAELMTGGWIHQAAEELRIADTLEAAAGAERRGIEELR